MWPQNPRVKVLAFNTSECDFVWREGLCRSDQVKVRSLDTRRLGQEGKFLTLETDPRWGKMLWRDRQDAESACEGRITHRGLVALTKETYFLTGPEARSVGSKGRLLMPCYFFTFYSVLASMNYEETHFCCLNHGVCAATENRSSSVYPEVFGLNFQPFGYRA